MSHTNNAKKLFSISAKVPRRRVVVVVEGGEITGLYLPARRNPIRHLPNEFATWLANQCQVEERSIPNGIHFLEVRLEDEKLHVRFVHANNVELDSATRTVQQFWSAVRGKCGPAKRSVGRARRFRDAAKARELLRQSMQTLDKVGEDAKLTATGGSSMSRMIGVISVDGTPPKRQEWLSQNHIPGPPRQFMAVLRLILLEAAVTWPAHRERLRELARQIQELLDQEPASS